jgi:hypothetical protein
MKRIILLLSTAAIIFCLSQKSIAAPNPREFDFGMRFGYFYSSLSPHGEWIEIEPGFHVWRPFHISHQWRPYLVGRWVWTDYGWYWMSREPFGWITYHYGRWYYDDYYGWVWMPDDVWAPAWVEWRYDDDYIGWAPLPPYATFRFGVGFRYTTHWVAPVHYWNFVKYHRFGSVFRYRDTAPEEHARRLIGATRSGNQFEVDRDRIINRGVDRNIIEQRGNVRIQRAEVQDARGQSGERMTRSDNTRDNNRIEIYRPSQEEMQRGGERFQSRRGERSLSIDMSKLEQQRDSRSPSDTRTSRETTRQSEQKDNREVKQEDQPREYTPRVQEQSQRDSREKRRELIQRNDREQKPTPPTSRGTQQQNVEKKHDRIPNTSQGNRNTERRTDNQRERNR